MDVNVAKTLTLGILGGGQLGMFLALAAREQKLRVHLYIEKDEPQPARGLADEVTVGNGWSDAAAIQRFCTHCDVVLLENEFIPVELLQPIQGVRFVPNLAAYAVFQDKFQEKTLAQRTGVPVGDFQLVSTLAELRDLQASWGQLVLKTCRGGYDGTGNLTVDSTTAAEKIEKFLSRGACVAEKWIEFSHEVAVMVARSPDQEIVFPVAETIQHHHICHQVIAPARFDALLNERIQTAALELVRAANGVGLFGIEFFVTAAGELLYNETAPRPHNSAHFTIEGCTNSQFQALLQVALGQPLTSPQLRSAAVGMLNLLGTVGGTNELRPRELFENQDRGHLWLYGKKESRPGRKLGHYTLLGDGPNNVILRMTQLQASYQL